MVGFFRSLSGISGIESETKGNGELMKGYLVFTRDKMINKDEMATYSKDRPSIKQMRWWAERSKP